MPLPESSLSIVCNSIGDFVRSGINAAANNITVSLGSPADMADVNDQHRINLFFYRFEPAGFQSMSHPQDPWQIRLFCLVTAFGVDEDGVSAGENDLRMLGELMRIFHENQVSASVDVNGLQVRLQMIFSPMTDEQINQIWSTQGDTTYRASLVYEMALAPIVPAQLRPDPPRVGSLGHQALTPSQQFADFNGNAAGPLVPLRRVNISDPRWQAQICWIYQGGCQLTLSFDVDSDEFNDFEAQLWIAGDSSSPVTLHWDIWDPELGWRPLGASVVATPFNQMIDPENIPAVSASFPFTLAGPLPFSIPVGATAAQGMLYASRTVTVEGQGDIEIRSNPLLISLYREA